jgi:Arc/MetJ-type ribon-helix-helix transcriptional regulator
MAAGTKRSILFKVFSIDPYFIHAYTVYMERMQILFPEPQLSRLRKMAKRQDRPVSELVRSAVDLWLSRYSAQEGSTNEKAPVYSCGSVKVSAEDLRDIANRDRGSR